MDSESRAKGRDESMQQAVQSIWHFSSETRLKITILQLITILSGAVTLITVLVTFFVGYRRNLDDVSDIKKQLIIIQNSQVQLKSSIDSLYVLSVLRASLNQSEENARSARRYQEFTTTLERAGWTAHRLSGVDRDTTIWMDENGAVLPSSLKSMLSR